MPSVGAPAATIPETDARPPPLDGGGVRMAVLGFLAAGAAVAGVLLLVGRTGDVGPEVLRACLVGAWALAGAVVSLRRPRERLGPLLVWGATAGGVASLAAAVLRTQADGTYVAPWAVDVCRFALPLTLAALPAVGMHVLLSLPDGRSRIGRAPIVAGYVVALGVGLLVWSARPSLPLWPVAMEVAAATTLGLIGSNRRYRRSAGASASGCSGSAGPSPSEPKSRWC